MRFDLSRLEHEITPLLTVHGVELVALEFLHGPGHGILRITIDRPDGDPRVTDLEHSISLEQVTNVTRDVSTALDALDLIEESYTLEIGSPGPERPVQHRKDFERFQGLRARIEARGPGRERSNFSGTLLGTADRPDARFAIRIDVAGKVHEIDSDAVVRARLHELAPPPRRERERMSRRQQRLAERERSRAMNAAHLASRSGRHDNDTVSTPAPSTQSAGGAGHSRPHVENETEHAAPESRDAKR